eukprot:gene26569-35237_t
MSSSLVNNKYRITKRIGGGSFGEIYMGVGPNNEKVAVKFERHGTRCPQLRHEYKVYRELINCHGFCSVYHFGTQDNYNVMVMDLLGPSLEDLFNKCNRRFSLKTVLQIADQMLERVDTLHSRHLIHRDIKPANFVIGLGDQGANVYCVDFGLSKRYRHPKNLQHIPHRDGRSLTGTPRYASINNHLGIEQSRRDDLESIGYVLIYFLKGTLPWQGLKAKNAQKKYRLILEKKQQVSIAQLCQGCPSQFAEFLAYTRSLKFDAKPDIPYLRKLFRDLYHAQGCGSVPKLWDWDGVDQDYFSAAGSTGPSPALAGGGPIPLNIGSGPRPTTSAAINGGLESDMLMGNNNDDLMDDDYDAQMNPNLTSNRPSTVGAAGYNTRSTAQQQQPLLAGGAAGNWGYSRNGPTNAAGEQLAPPIGNTQSNSLLKDPRTGAILGQSGGGIADYGTDRRPHTAAHGARIGAGGPSMLQQQQLGNEPSVGAYEGEDGDAHVVAGQPSRLRYLGCQSELFHSKWAMYQNSALAGGAAGAKGNANNQMLQQVQQQQQLQQQQQILRKTGAAPPVQTSQAAGGWNDRPKSAGLNSVNNAGFHSANGTGGLIASLTGAGRPSSSTQAMSGSNWNNGQSNVAGGSTANIASGFSPAQLHPSRLPAQELHLQIPLLVLKRTSWESVADLVGHAVSSLSTRFCPFMTTYTKYVTKPLPPSDDSRKTTWDTIRTTESNANTAASIKESKASSTSVNPYQYIHSSVTGSNPYRRRTPRIGIHKLRSVNSNSDKQKKTDDVSVVDRVVGDSSEVDNAVSIEESGKEEEEEEVKGEPLNEAMDRTDTVNSPGHSAAEPSVLVTVETSDSCAQNMEPSTAITTEDGVLSTNIEEPNHGDVEPDIGSTVAAATTMGEVSTSSDNLHQSPRSAPASQDCIAEGENEHSKIPAYSQLTESDQTLSSTQRYEDLNGQATSEDHITEVNSKEDSFAAHPASSSSSTVRGLYSVHQVVMAADRGVLYDAKVLQAKYVESSWQYFIHFNGWARRHDTWIEEALIGLPSDSARLEAIRETMKEEMKRAAATQADERARARAARKDNDGDSTALINNATDNSNSNDGEPNGDDNGGDSTGKRGTSSRKKRAVEVQVVSHQVPCCLVALGDQAGDIGSILDKVSFDKHFEKMYGGKNKQQLIEKSVESLKLHSTTSTATFSSSVNFNAITAAPPSSSMGIPSAQNNGPTSTSQQVTRTKDGKKRIRPMLIQQDSFLLPLQGGRIEGKVVSTSPYSHTLSSVATESHTTGISNASSAMVRKSSEIILERAGSNPSHEDMSTTVLWKVEFPSETVTCLAGVVLTDASIDSVSCSDKDIPYHGYGVVGSALGYLHILDISNGSEIVEKHILGAFFDTGGDVNVSVSLGKPDLGKRYRYSATSQTWQEIY